MKLFRYSSAICLAIVCLLGCTNQSADINNFKWYSYQELMELQEQHADVRTIQRLRLSNVRDNVDLSELTGLKELYISNTDWSEIKNIPTNISVLDIENVTGITLGKERYKNLKKLAIHDCSNFVAKIPSTVTNLFLDFCSNISLQDIPKGLTALKIIDTDISALTTVDLTDFSELKRLILHGGSNLRIGGKLPASLVEISIFNNGMRYNTFDISKLVNLRKFGITNVVNILLGDNTNLKQIQIFDSKNVHISGALPQSLEYVEARDTSFRHGEVLRVSKDTEVSLDGCKNVKVEKNY